MGQVHRLPDIKQKGGRTVRGVHKAGSSPLARRVKKGSVGIKLGLEGVPDNAHEVRGTEPVSLI